ncbi:MAG: LuxR C-terminal-related transcriptional regulator [Candidatus Limnocylindrales bacterium]
MGRLSIRAVGILVAIVMALFACSVLLPPMAGMSTYVAASAGIALVAATLGLLPGLAAVVLACGTAILVELSPVGEFHIDQPADAVALLLFAANGVTVAVMGSMLARRRSGQASAGHERRGAAVTIAAEAAHPVSRTRASQQGPHHPLEPLTEREAEVLAYLASGMSNAQIADSLFISVNTVKSHLKNVYGKLAVDSRTRAVTRAMELGVLPVTQSAAAGPRRLAQVSIKDEIAA